MQFKGFLYLTNVHVVWVLDHKEAILRIYEQITMLILLMTLPSSALCIDGKQKTHQAASKSKQNRLMVSSMQGRQKYGYWCPKRSITSEGQY